MPCDNGLDSEKMYMALADVVSEAWRLYTGIGKIQSNLIDPISARKLNNKLERFKTKFLPASKKLGLEIVPLDNVDYEDGLQVNPINLDDFSDDEQLVVDVILEPCIKKCDSGEIIKKAVVTLRRK